MLIVEFEWDDDNVAHFAERGLGPADVDAMLYSRITVTRNKKAGSGQYKFVGQGRGGQRLVVVVASTAVAGRWRPVTGRRV
jgi:uncharacterized DUF497 family protein